MNMLTPAEKEQEFAHQPQQKRSPTYRLPEYGSPKVGSCSAEKVLRFDRKPLRGCTAGEGGANAKAGVYKRIDSAGINAGPFPAGFLSLLIQQQLGIRAVGLVDADQDEVHIRQHTEA